MFIEVIQGIRGLHLVNQFSAAFWYVSMRGVHLAMWSGAS